MTPTTENLILLALKQILANQRILLDGPLSPKREGVELARANTLKLCEALDTGMKLIPKFPEGIVG